MKEDGRKTYELKDYYTAYEKFSRCVEISPEGWEELPGVLGNRAASLMMLERYVEVIEDCDRALKLSQISASNLLF